MPNPIYEQEDSTIIELEWYLDPDYLDLIANTETDDEGDFDYEF